MDKDTKFGIFVIAVPLLGLLYCALVFAVLINFEWARQHPVITAAFFVLTPSLISGSIWLFGSARAKNKERLGL
ncbi:MAG: hypothetical protein N5P05_003804 [Chroococcopsis gigantea SAG 12.99]|jgi:glucose uptake protein GlcU|nr:hypothetical protein [Chlorogloea purpurea SAG 13.99]MDV3002198.1 hypothetical protein [Chroococcopsis gigantea SAG 12.99]